MADQIKEPHILFSAAWYPNATGKQSSPFIKNHAEAISQFCRLSVLAVFSSNRHKTIKLERKIVNENLNEYLVYVPQFPIEKSPVFRVLAGILYFMGYLWGVFNILWDKKEGFALMHVNVLTRAGVVPMLINRIFSIPYIITEHWTRYYSEESFPTKGAHFKMTQTIVKNANSIHCAANKQAKAMQNCGLQNNNYLKFKNVVNTSLFYPTIREKNKVPRFSTVAFFRNKAKNISGILNVLHKLEKNGFQYKYVFIGNGEDLETSMSKASELGLKHVEFKGFQKQKSIALELQKSDCSILFSNFENQPVCIIESLACGTPVIATNVGDVAEMITENCGTLIEPKDQDALYTEMVRIIENKANFSSESCTQEAQKYSYSKVGKEFFDTYSNIIESNKI